LADICILTSKSEGLPVVHEYGKAIKPVLVDVGEIPAVVQNGKTVLSSRKRKSCFMQLL
jgi:hypothetical protein